jgi:hypothetical protein
MLTDVTLTDVTLTDVTLTDVTLTVALNIIVTVCVAGTTHRSPW